jgi:hypothetical protein
MARQTLRSEFLNIHHSGLASLARQRRERKSAQRNALGLEFLHFRGDA